MCFRINKIQRGGGDYYEITEMHIGMIWDDGGAKENTWGQGVGAEGGGGQRHRQLRARRALSLNKDVPLRTRRGAIAIDFRFLHRASSLEYSKISDKSI